MVSDIKPKPFSLKISPCVSTPEIGLVEITGYLDVRTIAEFENALLAEGSPFFRYYVVDATGLFFISSAGVSTMVRLVQTARSRRGEVALLRPGEQVRSLMELLSLNDLFQLVETVDEAISLFSAP